MGLVPVLAQIPYMGIFFNNYTIRAKRVKKIKRHFFAKKRGDTLRLAHVFGCYKLALLFEIMLDYITSFCIEVLRIHLSVREMFSLGMVSTNLFMLFYVRIQNSNCRRLEMAT